MVATCDYDRVKFYRIERNGAVVIGVDHPCFLNCQADALTGEVQSFLNKETRAMSLLIEEALSSSFARVENVAGCLIGDVAGSALSEALLYRLVECWKQVIEATRPEVAMTVAEVIEAIEWGISQLPDKHQIRFYQADAH